MSRPDPPATPPASPPPNGSPLPTTTSRRGLLAGLALGLPVVAYGIRGVLVDADRTHPPDLARWIVGAAAVHDLVLVPAVLLAGRLARRVTPARLWPPVRAALAATGVAMLVAWPFVRGYGRDPANPSLLPRDYGAGLAAAVVTIWLAAAVWAVVRWRARPARTPAGVRAGSPAGGSATRE